LKATEAGFPKAFRLNNPSDFSRVFESAGFRCSRGPVRITALSNDRSSARLGLVVGKRVMRRAVDRNRAKRVIRETFRTTRADLPRVDIIVQVTGPGSSAELRHALLAVLKELGEKT
jgi:ribonuclease P protein component